MEHIAYEYKNCPVPGGGYATGFLFHPAKKRLLYLRTDIGGTYRFDAAAQQWVFLSPHVTHLDCAQAFPIALAVDANRPQRLYILGGEYGKPCGELAISDDYGDTFTAKPVPFFVHGNLNGRGTGERLIVDAADPDTLWCASQRDGMWVTRDLGDTWVRVAGLPETHLTFVAQVNGKLIVGAAGVSASRRTCAGRRSTWGMG